MRNRVDIRKVGLIALIGAIVITGAYGCKKEEPEAWEEKLYKQTKIAFASDRYGNPGIYIMNSDGSGQRRLTTNNSGFDIEPSWSPDGKRIAFLRYALGDKNTEIYIMNADIITSRRHTDILHVYRLLPSEN